MIKMTKEEAEKAIQEGEMLLIECPPDGNQLPKPPRRKNCPTCGRFTRRNGSCPMAYYDDWSGGWEHG